MKISVIIFAVVILLISAPSCKNEAKNTEYETSYNTWLWYKNQWKNSYQYTATTSSWTRYSTETRIKVVDGVVTERYFKSYMPDGNGQTMQYQEWSETSSTINTHAEGFPARTMDDIYAEVKSKWIIKRDSAKIYFENNNNGMLSKAGYVDNNCMDDCFNGVQIVSIQKYPL